MLRIVLTYFKFGSILALITQSSSLANHSTEGGNSVGVWRRDQERAAAGLCNPSSGSGKHNATLLFLHVFKVWTPSINFIYDYRFPRGRWRLPRCIKRLRGTPLPSLLNPPTADP
jgi:hypothetical protein